MLTFTSKAMMIMPHLILETGELNWYCTYKNSHHRISTLPKNPINTDDNGFGNLHESIIRTAQQEEGMMKKCRYLSTIALARRGEQKKDIMWLALCSKHTLKRCFLHQSNNSNNVPRQKSFSCSASLNNLFDFDLI